MHTRNRRMSHARSIMGAGRRACSSQLGARHVGLVKVVETSIGPNKGGSLSSGHWSSLQAGLMSETAENFPKVRINSDRDIPAKAPSCPFPL